MNFLGRRCSSKPFVRHKSSFQNLFCVSEEVKNAIANEKPILALESTIITHGMPYPTNLDTAIQVEDIVRQNGAVPATIAVLNGVVSVGLSANELEILSQTKNSVKISRRDLPFAITKCLTGGTTVSATMLIAHKMGIKCFATGGIGGVHRGAEVTFDISADLRELGRTPVAVFSSGIKSILDIEKSLEYLETEGVSVTVLNPEGNGDFPNFYTSKSGFKVPFTVRNVKETAQLILNHEMLNIDNGILVAIPIPQSFDEQRINEAITLAVKEAAERGIKGNEVTPFVLKRVANLTDDESLKANVTLIKTNADIASQVLCEMNNLKRQINIPREEITRTAAPSNVSETEVNESSVVVVGGSILDVMLNVNEENINLDATTLEGNVTRSVGGVARNVADCISRLGHNTLLISCVGNDETSKYILERNPGLSKEGILTTNEVSTSTAYLIMDKKGDTKLLVCDMNAHNFITEEHAAKFEKHIKNSSMLLMDANLPLSTMDYILNVCYESGVPVFYEPTDPRLASKIFQINSRSRDCVIYASPNLLELQYMYETLCGKPGDSMNDIEHTDIERKCQVMAEYILDHCFETLLITLGADGNLLVSRKPLLDCLEMGPRLNFTSKGCDSYVYHFPVENIPESEIVSSSGAGDCFVGGFVSGLIRRKPIKDCLRLGQTAASLSLKSTHTVPIEIESINNRF
ncbi:pseudouridine-metabolizing bifunctional protein-like protein [Leptotrombidium deliense]|uniref:Pseudouridine-metabolizing bifunctional protein-like protein n=1 Tax=Leptotrombidium deliense TaxID=299467 RepID=A0A443SCM6_9ACAR|nr:pseudouridine-metabolizing bifunctional protein-like protein [Leptotrombidium deliense]